VANVGEQRPNSDAKVFQVDVEIAGTDPSLRPAMTTSNRIITMVFDSVLYVPLECLHSLADTITFVYKREGITTVKQEIMLGETNANDAIILAGLSEGDRLFMSLPSGVTGDVRLIPEMNGKRKKPEPQQPELPLEQTITLPNGQVIKVSGNNSGQFGAPSVNQQGRGGMQQDGQQRPRGDGQQRPRQQGSQPAAQPRQ
jgi:hypothetical protein